MKKFAYFLLTGLFFFAYFHLYKMAYRFVTNGGNNVFDIFFLFFLIIMVLPLSLISSRWLIKMIRKDK